MAVVHTVVATDKQALENIDHWVEEGVFEPRAVTFDEQNALVRVPFEQEDAASGLPPDAPDYDPDDGPYEDLGLPAPLLISATKSVAEYKVPVFRCQLEIAAVERAKISGRSLDHRRTLGHIEYEDKRRAVVVSVIGPVTIQAAVARLHVSLQVTDEIVGYYRRRYYRWGAATISPLLPP